MTAPKPISPVQLAEIVNHARVTLTFAPVDARPTAKQARELLQLVLYLCADIMRLQLRLKLAEVAEPPPHDGPTIQ